MGAASGITAARVDHVVVGVGENHETFLDKDAGGFEQSGIVGEERLFVADDFQLDPVGEADFAPQHGGAHRVVGGVAGGRIGQDKYFRAIDVIDQGFLGAVRQIDAAHGYGHHIGAAGLVAAHHLLKAAVLPGSNDKARGKFPPRDG